MRLLRFVKPLVTVAVVAGLAAGAYFTRDRWLPWFRPVTPAASAAPPGASSPAPERVIINEQAQKNLGLTARPLKAETFWRTIQVPGMVVDPPGRCDRDIVAPAVGVIDTVFHVPGDTVRAGDVLFTLKLTSEPLHLTQTELYKTAQDMQLAQAQRKRLVDSSGAVAESKVIEVESQITRLEVLSKAYRQELQTRGLTPKQIADVAEGKFVTQVAILVPPDTGEHETVTVALARKTAGPTAKPQPAFEVQELKIALGQQVEAGQTLCLLADHQLLAIEGRAFRDETPLLERAMAKGWPLDVDFQEDPSASWPGLDQPFRVRTLANTIDPTTRTFTFLVPLENQSGVVERDGRTQTLWRFRPGQRTRLYVRVEKLDNVFVLPDDAVTRDGPETFLFTQNVNTFERRGVHVLLQDRQHVVLANDGSLLPGLFVVQSGATQLNRMLKSATSTVPKGYHVHADGSLHKNSDE